MSAFVLFLKTAGGSSPWLTQTEIFRVFSTILQDEELRQDPDIRSGLLNLSQTHPFTDIRASAQLALSDFNGDVIPSMFR